MPAWKQSYLKGLVYGDNPQVNFVTANYGAYDGATKPYGTPEPVKASSEPMRIGAVARINSVMAGVSKSVGSVSEIEAKANTFYGEGSAPNKRPHIEEEPSPSTQGTVQQPAGIPQMSAGSPYQFQAVAERTKKKGQKRTGKKTEPQPLVGMMNETGAYDKPLSIRHVLKNNKVDITWMDYLA